MPRRKSKRRTVSVIGRSKFTEPTSSHLNTIKRKLRDVPFGFTIFFTDENGNSIKYGQYAKIQEEVMG
jgi:hypothetical protein